MRLDFLSTVTTAQVSPELAGVDLTMALQDIRKSYDKGDLNEDAIASDPVEQFQTWLDEALATGMLEPTAMTLATVGADGQPSARMVLLKGVDAAGFRFYSNYESRKGRELAANPRAALMFYWDVLERQVRVEGEVSTLSREASKAYFKSRPYGSQIGALASPQSRVLSGRGELERRTQTLMDTYPEGEVPLPDTWGGYCLSPSAIEFWQGRPSRLHDRLKYVREDGGWKVVRLSP